MSRLKRRAFPITDAVEASIQAGIAADPDNPELTDAELARMRPASEVLPAALLESLMRGGRSQGEKRKVQLTLRVDPDIVEAYRATGPGWQSRMNEALARGAAGLVAREAE